MPSEAGLLGTAGRSRAATAEAPASASRRLAWRSSQTSALAPTARGGRGHGWSCRRKASQGCSPRVTSSGPPRGRTVNGTFANVRTAMTDGSVRGWRHVPGARALQSPATASECPRSGLFSPSAQPGSGSGLAAVEARRFAAAVRARGCRSRGTRLAWFGRHLDRHAPGRDRATAWAARGRVRAGAVRVARRSPRGSS